MSAAPFGIKENSNNPRGGIPQEPVSGGESRRSFQAKDIAVFSGWIAGIIIIAAFSWILLQPVKNRFLVRAVNRVFGELGDTRRLREFTRESAAGIRGSFGMGAWFTITDTAVSANAAADGTKAFVFSFMGEGTFFPCAALINKDGKLEEFIPLSNHGKKIMQRISPGILNIYAKRIEGLSYEPAS